MEEQMLKNIAEEIEIFLGQAGFAKDELYDTSYLKDFMPVCHELYKTGTYDVSVVDPGSLYHFTVGVLYTLRAIAFYEGERYGQQNFGPFVTSLFASMGYMFLEYPEYGADGLNEWEFENAMTSLSRMKMSSFRSALSIAGISIGDRDAVIEFVKGRRGYIPLNLVNREAQTDNIKFDYMEQTMRIVSHDLLERAKWRGISTEKMMSVLSVHNEDELKAALTEARNAPSVSALLSLDLDSFMALLYRIELDEAKEHLERKYAEAMKAEVIVTAKDLKEDDERISPEEFIGLLGSGAKVHPSYRSNKKMKGLLLDDGRELGIELTTSKTVNIWINHNYLTPSLKDFHKNTIGATTPESKPYGRHSALRMYHSLAWEPVSQLVVKNVGEAIRLVNLLLHKA